MHRILSAGAMGVALLLVAASPAFAHEHRDVGAYSFTVGFSNEPAYTGSPNGASVTINDKSGKAVADLPADALKVEVVFGDQRKPMALEASDEKPGEYHAYFIPTRPGKYTFHFTGNIKGQAVDESFTSSPTTFNEVDDATESEFPVKDPSPGELASRLDRDIPRLTDKAKKAKDSAGSAMVVAVIGLVLALVGVGAGVAAGRRRA